MKEKEQSIGSKFLGLFVAEEGAEPPEIEPELVDDEPEPAQARRAAVPGNASPAGRAAAATANAVAPAKAGGAPNAPAGRVAPPGRATPSAAPTADGGDPMLAADFDTIYAKVCEAGDPSAEAILTAYGEMSKTLTDKVLATAMNSMIKGIRADIASVRDTLSKRYSTLQNVVDRKKKYYGNKRNARAKELDEKRVATQAQVQQLQLQIAELTEALRQTEAQIQQADAEDLGTVEAFNQRVGAEFSRLSTLAQFLDSISPPNRG